nr:AMP-binding protein [Anaerolineae bacterium]
MVSYADKPWTRNYDSGVPASLAPYPNISIFEMLDQTVSRFPDNTACISSADLPLFGRKHAEITYRELGDLSDRLAAGLAAMGVKKGDRVALHFANSTQFIIGFFGISKAGGIVVAINPTFPPKKIAEQLNDSGAETLIT